MRLIGQEGEQLGVMPTERAKERAREEGVDLVEVSPQARPPVCKLMDYGKFLYQQKKQAQKAKKAGKQNEMKFIRISPRIGEHDLETKARRADEFLEKKHVVKLELRFRGREIVHPEVAEGKIGNFVELLSWGDPEGKPKKQGRQMILIIHPSNKPKNNEAKDSLRNKKTDSSDGEEKGADGKGGEESSAEPKE